MAHSSVMVRTPLSDPLDLLQNRGQTGPDYLTWVSNIVSTNKGKTYKLKSPAGATWSVGDLNDTIYKDDNEMVYEWGNFYLEEEVSMQVLGVVEGTSIPGEELVLMTCEDRKMYIYGERELYLVAPSLEHLCKLGIDDSESVTYDRGDAFKDLTDEDWDEERNLPEEEQHQLMMSPESIMSHLPKNE